MHLPAEIHHLILSYVTHADLPSYRLACYSFAERGAARLFARICVKATRKSADGLVGLSRSETLRKRVKSLVWDTDLYDVGVTSFEEWVKWCRNAGIIACVEGEEVLDLEEEYRRYVERRAEEEDVLGRVFKTTKLRDVLGRFEKMERVEIRAGMFGRSGEDSRLDSQVERRISEKDQGYGQENDYYGRSARKMAYTSRIPCEIGAHRTHTSHPYPITPGSPPGISPLQSIQFFLLTRPPYLKALSISYLSWRFFTKAIYPWTIEQGLEHLTTLQLCLSTKVAPGPDEKRRRLCEVRICRMVIYKGLWRRWLRCMPQLKKLALGLDERCKDYEKPDILPGAAAALLDNVLPVQGPLNDPATLMGDEWAMEEDEREGEDEQEREDERVWTSLHTLALSNFDTSPRFLIRFLLEHRHSLKVLRLDNIVFSRRGCWRTLLQAVRPCLKLEAMGLSGILWDDTEARGGRWDMEGGLGALLGKWMVDTNRDRGWPLDDDEAD